MSGSQKGYFVVFEGIDGIGKSTVFAFLKERFEQDSIPYVFTHEPTDGPIGKTIYGMLRGTLPMVSSRELQRLYIEDRKEHMETVIRPELERGMVVVSDRYWLSTLAYGMLSEPKETFINLHTEVIPDFLLPHLTILLDAPAELALERLGNSNRELDFFEKLEKQKQVRMHYLELVASGIDPNIVVVDARNEPKRVAELVWDALSKEITHHSQT